MQWPKLRLLWMQRCYLLFRKSRCIFIYVPRNTPADSHPTGLRLSDQTCEILLKVSRPGRVGEAFGAPWRDSTGLTASSSKTLGLLSLRAAQEPSP